MGSSWSLVLLLFAVLGSNQVQGWDEFLSPPEGNSPYLKVKTSNGRLAYRCINRKWKIVSASADLLSTAEANKVLGNFSYAVRGKHLATWTLFNNPADATESGARMSTVTAKLLSYSLPGSVSEALFQVASHDAEGGAELVSYVQRLNPRGGVPQSVACQSDYETRKLPYYAEYQFWRQDTVPPAVPKQLILPVMTPVTGFFGEGQVVYKLIRNKWEQADIAAKLYTVPGGAKVGTFYAKPESGKSGTHVWSLNNPNGFQATGKVQKPPVAVSDSSLPWTTSTIISRKGNNTRLGVAKAVQMLSTRGGTPTARNAKASTAGRMKVPFSAVFWFYK